LRCEIAHQPIEKTASDFLVRQLPATEPQGHLGLVTLEQEIGRRLLDRLVGDLATQATVEQNPLMEGRQMVMVFAPKKK